MLPLLAINQQTGSLSEVDVDISGLPRVRLVMEINDIPNLSINSYKLSLANNEKWLQIDSSGIVEDNQSTNLLLFVVVEKESHLRSKKYLTQISLLTDKIKNTSLFAYINTTKSVAKYNNTFGQAQTFSKKQILNLLNKHSSENKKNIILLVGDYERNTLQQFITYINESKYSFAFIRSENENTSIIKDKTIQFMEDKKKTLEFFDLINDNINIFTYVQKKINTINATRKLEVFLSYHDYPYINIISDTLFLFSETTYHKKPFSIIIPELDNLEGDRQHLNKLSLLLEDHEYEKALTYMSSKYKQGLISATAYQGFINDNLNMLFEQAYNNKQLVEFIEMSDNELRLDTIQQSAYLKLRKQYLLRQYIPMMEQHCYNEVFLNTNKLLQKRLPDSLYLKAEYYNGLGYIAYKEKEYGSTLNNFQISYKLTKSDYRFKETARVLKETLSHYYKTRQFDDFRRTYEKFQYFTDNNLQLHYEAARVYLYIKDYKRSLKEFKWINAYWKNNNYISKEELNKQIIELQILSFDFVNACNNSQNTCMSTNNIDTLDLFLKYYIISFKSLYFTVITEALASCDKINFEKTSNVLAKHKGDISELIVYDNKIKQGIDLMDINKSNISKPEKVSSPPRIIFTENTTTIIASNNLRTISLKFHNRPKNKQETAQIRNIITKRTSTGSWNSFNLNQQEKYLMMISRILGTLFSETDEESKSIELINKLHTNQLIEYITLQYLQSEKEITKNFQKDNYVFDDAKWQKSLTTSVYFKQEIWKADNKHHIIIDCCTPLFYNNKRMGILRIGFNKIWN